MMRIARCLLLASCLPGALPGCIGGGSSVSTEERPPETGDILKVTYLRYDPTTDGRNLKATYRVMLSASWKNKFGETPREPLARLFPMHGRRPPFMGEVPDREMKTLLREMESKGLKELPSTLPEEIDLAAVLAPEKVTGAGDTHPGRFVRIITVGGDGWHRSYAYQEAHPHPPLQQIFAKVEREVLKMAVQFTIQVTREATPLIPKDK